MLTVAKVAVFALAATLVASSRVITTVTGEAVTRRLESGYVIEVLKGQPGSEIVFFTTKTQPFQEDNLVSTQAVREYLASSANALTKIDP